MARTRHQPVVLAVGFAAGLLVSATACALITSAAPAVTTAPAARPEVASPEAASPEAARPDVARLAAVLASARAPERDPFAPLVDGVPDLPGSLSD